MKRRKFLAVILIISMFFTNIGVETFATSFSNILKVKKNDDAKIELQQRYYKEYRRESPLYLLNDENNEVDNDNVEANSVSPTDVETDTDNIGANSVSLDDLEAGTDKNISLASKSHIKNINHSTESNIENLNESDISDEDDDETQSDTRDSNVAEPEDDPADGENTTSEDVETTINKSSEVETNLDNVGTPTDEPDSVATNSDIDETSNDKTTEADINITSNDNLASPSITNEVAEASISDILLNDILDIPTTLPTPSTADDETFGASRVYWYIAVTGTIYTLYFSNTSAASYGAAANGQFNSAITGMDSQGWNTYKSLIRNVIISNNITPPGDSMAYWFQGLTNVTSITGLNRIDTSNVTDFERTFQNCSSLTSLDLSSFNTSNATNMKYMFGGCSSLTSLNISSFNTSNVTTMENMFYNCSSLTNINLSSFNTSHVTSMDSMFSGASSLNSISLSNFNTSNVDSMHSTFYNCTNLTILDLSNFDTHNVSAMSNMFNNCTNLTTIYASSKFVITNVVIPNLTDMFTNCTSLAGDSGTTFTSAGVTNATYAHLDGGSSNPGYFSNPPLRWYLTTTTNANDTLHIASGSNTAYDSATNKGTFTTFNTSTSQGWNSFKSNITKVVIDNNLKPVKNNMMHWFNGLSIVTEFTNLNNINTSTVTNMEALFSNCLQLTNLDLSSFDTSNVTNMNDMFADTTHLNNINLSSFDTRNVTSMKNMFYDCRDINILNLSTFDTSNVTDMRWMFYNCSNLSTIYASTKFITTAVTQSSSMFSACTNLLQGENGTIWSNSNPADKTYARLDGGTANPGYFSNPPLYWYLTTVTNTNDTLHISSVSNASYDSATNKGTFTNFTTSTSQPWNTFKSNITNIIIDNTVKPRKNDMSYWFTNITNLTSITNINNIDTSDTTNMQYAFASCSNLTSVNINSFNTSNVTSVTNMFSNCNNLSTITLPTSFGQNATDFSNLFKNCNNLQTINLNNINTSHATTFEHMFDCCSSLTSIDVSGFSTNNVTNMSYMFASCSNLTNIDASNFNTRYTNNTSYMFSNCSQIQTISLGALDYTDFENLDYMFANCSNLTTINVSVDIQVFVLAAGYGVPSASSTNMFLNCNNLVGGAGYPYNPNHIDGEFAKVDRGGIYPGYFTYNGTTPIDYSAWSYTLPANWKANLPIPATDITEIIFTDATTFPTTTDEFILTSVAAGTITVTPINHFGYVDGTTVIFHKKAGTQLVAPTDMSEYFANLPNLERITNINLLNTNNVTSTRELFNSNAKLQNIDLSALNLNNVLDTSNMFNG
ncbi:MAG: BspA family leucine-rich repeat surface protein, partial [Lachnospiraceae bacterium]|nr:BspA family leucine-rich repeat surface protein [Lachnospiraceae bacterium]